MGKKDKKCISDCFPPKTLIVHPLLLRTVTDNKPFCLITPQEENNKLKKWNLFKTQKKN